MTRLVASLYSKVVIEDCRHLPDMLVVDDHLIECPFCGKVWIAADDRDRYRALLERLVDASDKRGTDDQKWLEALYAARNELRGLRDEGE